LKLTNGIHRILKLSVPRCVLVEVRKIERATKKVSNQFLMRAMRICFKKLVITYDADFNSDGTGAQLQRQFGVFVLSRILKCNYQFSPIKNIAVHALDPFQSETDYFEFLEKLNHDFEVSCEQGLWSEITAATRIASPSIYRLIGVGVKSFFNRGLTLVKVGDPYSITEYFQDTYDEVLPNLLNWSHLAQTQKIKILAIHYRQGVGGKVIYPGQKIPRELDLGYFIKVIQYIKRIHPATELKILVLTDAPSTATTYAPPVSQHKLWENTPGFNNGKMLIAPFDFSPLETLQCDYKIIAGGNPIDAIKIMSTADFLLMGRSSLSFVAGVLNQNGVVFTAPEFWHNSLSRWTSYTDSVLKSKKDTSK